MFAKKISYLLAAAILLCFAPSNLICTDGEGEMEGRIMRTPAQDLQNALVLGDTDKIQELVIGNPDLLDGELPSGRTPLTFAAELALEDMVRFLLNLGADPFKEDSHGANAADIAWSMKREEADPGRKSAYSSITFMVERARSASPH